MRAWAAVWWHIIKAQFAWPPRGCCKCVITHRYTCANGPLVVTRHFCSCGFLNKGVTWEDERRLAQERCRDV